MPLLKPCTNVGKRRYYLRSEEPLALTMERYMTSSSGHTPPITSSPKPWSSSSKKIATSAVAGEKPRSRSRPGVRMRPAEEFSTLVHAIAHEMLHLGERRTLTTKQVRETEAEAVAFVVCQSVGLQTGTTSADYIQALARRRKAPAREPGRPQRTAAVIGWPDSSLVHPGPSVTAGLAISQTTKIH